MDAAQIFLHENEKINNPIFASHCSIFIDAVKTKTIQGHIQSVGKWKILKTINDKETARANK